MDKVFCICVVMAMVSMLLSDMVERKVNNKIKTRNLLSIKYEFDITAEEEEKLQDLMVINHYTNEGKYIRECLFHE